MTTTLDDPLTIDPDYDPDFHFDPTQPLAPDDLAHYELESRQRFERVARDTSSAAHDDRVGWLAYQLAQAMGYDSESALRLGHAATLHDIGKQTLPASLLEKPGRFTDEERRLMQTHVDAGYALLKRHGTPFMDFAASIALSHHERWDGTGYPLGRAGLEIPLQARIVSICDAYDAMTEQRPYQPTRSPTDAMRELSASRGQLDPYMLAVFLEVVTSDVYRVAMRWRGTLRIGENMRGFPSS
jgi:HD-GYP domain-containing protein (c-di-GMP phosphodiesterase class II)